MILLFLLFLLFYKKVRKVLEKYLDDFLMQIAYICDSRLEKSFHTTDAEILRVLYG
jgi:hypothetical protein